jgi:hypothetical protein
MKAEHILLALLCAPSVTLVLIFVLIETYDKVMEIILTTIAFIVAIWEWRKKKAQDAMKEIEQ